MNISLNLLHKVQLGNKWALAQVMAWHQMGDKPSPESLVTKLSDAM